MPFTILHVADLSEIGGIPRVVMALAAGHRDLGLDVHVAMRCNSEEEGERLGEPYRAAGLTTHPLTGARAYRSFIAGLAALCERIGADVVHTHGLRSDILGGMAARSAGTPQVSTIHGFTDSGWRGAIYHLLHRRMIRRAEAVVAVSRPLEDKLSGAGVRADRLHLIPNAFRSTGPLRSRADARAALGIAAEAKVAGWVGRLSLEKGADVAIEALARAADRSVALAILGDGPERPALAALAARLGVDGRVVFHGALAGAPALFPAFDVFVLSSRSEGTPIALFEAMSAGVPIVATTVGGVPDVVSASEAWLVPPLEPALLARAIDDVLAHPAEAQRRTAAARARLEAQFAPGPWLDRYAAIYRAVAERAR